MTKVLSTHDLCGFFLGLFVVLGGAVKAHGQENIPAFDLFKPATNKMLTLSPDGRHLAFISSETEKFCLDGRGQMKKRGDDKCPDQSRKYRSIHKIIIADVDAFKSVRVFPLPENFHVSWMTWVNDERLLTSLNSVRTHGRHGNRHQRGGARILSLPLEGDDYFFLFQDDQRMQRQNRYNSGITDILYDDPKHVLLPAYENLRLSLWKVNILTGEKERIARGEPNTFEWFTDRDGNPALRFDCADGKYCPRVDVHAPQEGLDKAWPKVMTYDVKHFEDRQDHEFWPLSGGPENGQFYFLSDKEGDTSANIKLYDVNKKAVLETTFQDENWDVSGGLFDSRSGDFKGAWLYKDRLTYVFTDPVIQSHYDIIKGLSKPDENIEIINYNEEKRRAVYMTSSPVNSGKYYVYNLDTQSSKFLFNARPWLDDLYASETELLDVITRDGANIRAYLTAPKDVADGETRLIVMPHGGPELRDYYDYNAMVQYYVSRGYSVLQINFRGSSGYGRAFAEAGHGEWGGTMQNDVIDAVQSLYDSGRASPEKTCIVGGSYGGYVALYAGGNTPEMFKCVVSIAGDSDLPNALKNARKVYSGASAAYAYWVKSIGDPKADKQSLKSRSPVNMAEDFKAPVLLIHGEYDNIVFARQSKDMRNALKKAGKTVEYIEYEEEFHRFHELETTIDHLDKIAGFLQEHIGP